MAENLNRTHFAEVAEALGVSTDAVMGTFEIEDSGGMVVLYTRSPEPHPDEWIWVARLQRDRFRVLVITSRKQSMKWSEFQDNAEEVLRRAAD